MQTEVLNDAGISFDGTFLTIWNSRISRKWKLVHGGFAPVSFAIPGKKELLPCDPDPLPSWDLCGMAADAEISGFQITSFEDMLWLPHLRGDFFFRCSRWRLELCWRVICFPEAPRIRTTLGVRAMEGVTEKDIAENCWPHDLVGACTERLPLEPEKFSRTAFGYYSNSQHRYHPN